MARFATNTIKEAPEKEIICAKMGAVPPPCHPQWERQSADLNPINISLLPSPSSLSHSQEKPDGSISHHFQKSLDLGHGHRQGQPEGEQPQLHLEMTINTFNCEEWSGQSWASQEHLYPIGLPLFSFSLLSTDSPWLQKARLRRPSLERVCSTHSKHPHVLI